MDPVSRAQMGIVPQKRRRNQIDPSVGIPTQFKPGNRANPGGRPKKAHITRIYEEILANAKTRDEIKQAVIQTLTSGRMAGVLLLREAAERTEGKITQEIDVTGTLQVLTDEQLEQKLLKLVNVA